MTASRIDANALTERVKETLAYVKKVQGEWNHGPWEVAKEVERILTGQPKQESKNV